MRSPKFKVGDKVRVLRASTSKERYLWGDSWCPLGMNDYIGKVLTISSVHCDILQQSYEYCKYAMRESSYNYPEFVLQKITVKGQQLVFSFMEEE